MSISKKTNLLRNLGMKDVAIKVYLFLLKQKRATILEISRHTGVARTNIYNHIDFLIHSGLVGESIEGKKKFYYVESPDNLSTMVENQLDIAKQASALLTPDYQSNPHFPKIRFGHGTEGFKKFAKETLKAKHKVLYQIINLSTLVKYASKKYLNQYWSDRVKNKIHAKILVPHDDRQLVVNSHNVVNISEIENILSLREVRFLPKNFNAETSIITFDTTVQFFAPLAEGYIFSFDSPTLTRTIKSFFNSLWENAQPFRDN